MTSKTHGHAGLRFWCRAETVSGSFEASSNEILGLPLPPRLHGCIRVRVVSVTLIFLALSTRLILDEFNSGALWSGFLGFRL